MCNKKAIDIRIMIMMKDLKPSGQRVDPPDFQESKQANLDS
jgi:hypothetical protein